MRITTSRLPSRGLFLFPSSSHVGLPRNSIHSRAPIRCRLYTTSTSTPTSSSTSTSNPTSQSSSSTSTSPTAPSAPSTKDPSHPYLHYHTLPSQLALSFLPTPPIYGSKTVLGYLPLGGGSGLGDLGEEPRFLQVLHDSIRDALTKKKGKTVTDEAAGRPGDGYIHITDERAIPPAGRIGETEDLIGSVFVQDGKVIPSTYEPLPSYRLITSNGPLILPEGLAEHLIETLEKIDVEEKAESNS